MESSAVAGKRQPTLADRAAGLERQASGLAADAEKHPELFEPGEAARYRQQAITFGRKAFTLRVHSRGTALRAVPKQRRSRERRPSASRRVSRTAGARGDPPHLGDDDPDPLSRPWAGFVAASVRLHVHLQRRTAKAAA
jgi:hypothetical protein